MKSSECIFPIDNIFLDALKMMWEQGWLDEYSEDHFLIRAIKGDLPNYRTKEQMNLVSPDLYFSCDTPINFLSNFSSKLERLISLCGCNNAKKFVKDQLSAGKRNYSEDQFFEALHEIHVLTYMTRCGSPNVEYEPEIGGLSGKKNPEYRIKNRFAIPSYNIDNPAIPAEDYLFDVEVKSIVGRVDSKLDLAQPFITPIVSIKYGDRQKLIDFCGNRGFQVELPNVIQLRNFLNDASAKFVKPTCENHFNLLFINWTYREIPLLNFMEPLSILDNPINGLYRDKNIGMKFGISEDVFDKTSAIFICSYPKQALIFNDIRWVFKNKKCAVLFNPNLNEKQKIQLTNILHMAPSANPETPLILSNPPVTSLVNALALSNLEGVEKIIDDIRFM